MSIYMAAFGYELLAALEELVDCFEQGDSEFIYVVTLAQKEIAEYRALIAREKGEGGS